MSFPHLDRCSCGSPSSTRDTTKAKQGGITNGELTASLLQGKKNDYRSSPSKPKLTAGINATNSSMTRAMTSSVVATTSTISSNNNNVTNNISNKISSYRSQPSLQDENLKNLNSLQLGKMRPIDGRQKWRTTRVDLKPDHMPGTVLSPNKADSKRDCRKASEVQINKLMMSSTTLSSTNGIENHSSTASSLNVYKKQQTVSSQPKDKSTGFGLQPVSMVQQTSNSNAQLSRESFKNAGSSSTSSKNTDISKQTNGSAKHASKSGAESSGASSTQESTATRRLVDESSSNTEYTPLSYDVNYVKVSPPKLTRRPKKSDETGGACAGDNNNITSGQLTRAQQLMGRRSWEENPLQQQQKRVIKAPARTPPEDGGKMSKEKKRNVDTNFPTSDGHSSAVVSSSTTDINATSSHDMIDGNLFDQDKNDSVDDDEQVLELTFTVLLERGTLKSVNKLKSEETGDSGSGSNSATIKFKTDNVVLDANSKRIVAESISEALRETGNQLGQHFSPSEVEHFDSKADAVNLNTNSAQIQQTISTGSVGTYGSNAVKNSGTENLKSIIRSNASDQFNERSPYHDRSSIASRSFDCNATKNSMLQEAMTSYQSLDRKQTISKDYKLLSRFDSFSHRADEYSTKKYQALNNISPYRLKTNQAVNIAHARCDSDISEYDSRKNSARHQKTCQKSSLKNGRWFKNSARMSEENGIALANDEMTHMNWDDLMKEANSLGIPLKRPGKTYIANSESDRDTMRFGHGTLASKLLRNFSSNYGSSKKSNIKLTKSICGGEIERKRGEYFDDLCSASYQCSYDTKKSSPFKEKFSFIDFILGRTKSSKNLAEDCPACRQQQQTRGQQIRNLVKRSMSTSRGACSTKHLKCSKNYCPECSCSCYCSCQLKSVPESRIFSRSLSSPPLTTAAAAPVAKKNLKNGKQCYDFCCQELNCNTQKVASKKTIFDTFSLSDGYRSLVSPKNSSAFRNSSKATTDPFSSHPFTPQNHRHPFNYNSSPPHHLLHLNSCGDDGGYEDEEENDCEETKDDVFLEDGEIDENKRRKNLRMENPKSAGGSIETGASNKNCAPQISNTSRASSKHPSTYAPSTSAAVLASNPYGGGGDSQNSSNGFLRSLHHLKDRDWYWGPLTFERAEEMLSDMPDGSFLVRDSSDERYILSVSFRSQGKTHHTRIEHIQGVFSFYSQRMVSSPDPGSSASIVNFIEDAVKRSLEGENLYYLRGNVESPDTCPTPVKLLYPVSKYQVPTLKNSCISLMGDDDETC